MYCISPFFPDGDPLIFVYVLSILKMAWILFCFDEGLNLILGELGLKIYDSFY
jgi:hypothetical protein